MTNKFRKFLKENNAYEKYIKNNKGESKTHTYILMGFIGYLQMKDMIIGMN